MNEMFAEAAVEFIRNSALDTRNFFDLDPNGNPTKSPFRRNQVGGSAGGPSTENARLFFGDYEGISANQLTIRLVTHSQRKRRAIDTSDLRSLASVLDPTCPVAVIQRIF
jgi:hypothetical protein